LSESKIRRENVIIKYKEQISKRIVDKKFVFFFVVVGVLGKFAS
jgi:hypothetical protein